MRIRELNRLDFIKLVLNNWFPLIEERDTIYLIISSDHTKTSLVAEDDNGSIIGYLLGLSSISKSVFMLQLHVKEMHRGNGVGTALIKEFEQKALAAGIETIWFLSEKGAKEFYTRLGYKETSTILPDEVIQYIQRFKSAVIMTKALGKKVD